MKPGELYHDPIFDELIIVLHAVDVTHNRETTKFFSELELSSDRLIFFKIYRLSQQRTQIGVDTEKQLRSAYRFVSNGI